MLNYEHNELLHTAIHGHTMNYWLMKSEPNAFSIEDLIARSNQTEPWDGVRNYQARNFMRKMKKGDLAFFYHSNAKPCGIVGVVEIVKEAYPDPTQFDPSSDYFDANSSTDDPRWDLVDIRFKSKFKQLISLSVLKEHQALSTMALTHKGNRLSVMPVSKDEWQYIMNLAEMG